MKLNFAAEVKPVLYFNPSKINIVQSKNKPHALNVVFSMPGHPGEVVFMGDGNTGPTYAHASYVDERYVVLKHLAFGELELGFSNGATL